MFSQLSFAQVVVNSTTPPKGSIPGKLVIRGSIQQLNEKLKDADIILYHDAGKTGKYVEEQRIITKKDGAFSFQIDLNSKYIIDLSKKGYTTKKVEFDTEVYQLTNQPAPFDFIVDMLPDRDGLKYINPVAKVFYIVKKQEFDYQLDNTQEQIKQEQERFKKQVEERAKQEGKEIEK